MRACAFILLTAMAIMTITGPIQCGSIQWGIDVASASEAPSLVTLDVCSKGSPGITAANAIPCVAQLHFVLERFDPNAYVLDERRDIISDAYLVGLDRPPQA